MSETEDTPPLKKLKVTYSESYEWGAQLWQNREQFTDVVLVVAGKEFQVHKMILASCSDYFKSLFYGGMREVSLNSITLFEHDNNITAYAFEKVLEYAYTKSIDTEEPLEEVLNIILVANYLQFEELKETAVKLLLDNIDITNVFKLFVFSRANSVILQGSDLENKCLTYIEDTSNTCKVLESSEFADLPKELIIELISRDTFIASENDILKAVIKWKEYNDVEDIDDVVQHIRPSRFTPLEIFTIVEPTGLFKQEDILDVVRVVSITNLSKTHPRGRSCPKKNLLSGKHEICIGINYSSADKCIDLEKCFLLNFLSFGPARSISQRSGYKYKVSVSMEYNQWGGGYSTIFNGYQCNFFSRGKQTLIFPTIPIRSIKIEINRSESTTENVSYFVTSLMLINDRSSYKCINGIIAPLTDHDVLFTQYTKNEDGKAIAMAYFNQQYSASTLLIKLTCDDPNVSLSSINCFIRKCDNDSAPVKKSIMQDIRSEFELTFDEMLVGCVKVIVSTAIDADKNLTISSLKCRSSATRDEVNMSEWGPFIRATTT